MARFRACSVQCDGPGAYDGGSGPRDAGVGMGRLASRWLGLT